MERAELRRLEENSFTIFVDNLPKSMTLGWLRQLFAFEGRITDAYLSRKRRKMTNAPFAFVRYLRRGGAQRAIMNLNGMVIRGHNRSF